MCVDRGVCKPRVRRMCRLATAIAMGVLGIRLGLARAQNEQDGDVETPAAGPLVGPPAPRIDHGGVFQQQIDGKGVAEVNRLLGPLQASLRLHPSFVRHYYGQTPKAVASGPLLLGPIKIAYSQYDCVLGKVFYDQSNTHADDWVSRYDRITRDMPRDEVEDILGRPQAYEQLLVEPYATGPGIPHAEFFYGPLPPGQDHRPLSLGRVSVQFYTPSDADPETWTASSRDYRNRKSGLAVQAWPPEACEDNVLPIQAGWATRHEHIKIGMSRAEVERILGEPTDSLSGLWCYGPRARVGLAWSLLPGLGRKVLIRYDEHGAVVSKTYIQDSSGYEYEIARMAVWDTLK